MEARSRSREASAWTSCGPPLTLVTSRLSVITTPFGARFRLLNRLRRRSSSCAFCAARRVREHSGNGHNTHLWSARGAATHLDAHRCAHVEFQIRRLDPHARNCELPSAHQGLHCLGILQGNKAEPAVVSEVDGPDAPVCLERSADRALVQQRAKGLAVWHCQHDPVLRLNIIRLSHHATRVLRRWFGRHVCGLELSSTAHKTLTALRSCCLDDPGIVACGKITVLHADCRFEIPKCSESQWLSARSESLPTPRLFRSPTPTSPEGFFEFVWV